MTRVDPANRMNLPAAQVSAEVDSPVNDILGRTPPWILRSGTSLVAAAVVLLLVMSWFIQYPDSINGRIIITGTNPAVPVMARQSGYLERLAIKEGDAVAKGNVLAVIKNAANTDALLQLKTEVQKLVPFLSDAARFVKLNLPGDVQLGNVQTAYTDFHARYRHYESQLNDTYPAKAIALLRAQMERKQAQLKQMSEQAGAARRTADLAKETFLRMQKVHSRGGISTMELQTHERQFLEADRQASMVDKSRLEEEIVSGEYEKQLNELIHKREEDLRMAAVDLADACKKLLGAVEMWETEFVLRAPTDGRVAFYDFWSDQQFVEQGKAVFIIAPEATVLLGRMPAKQGGSGKIKVGQRVQIRLDDYPSNEFGLVTGVVKSVSLVAQQGHQLVSVDLPYPLVTTYKKTILFKQEMAGQGMVITDDQRLIGRLFREVRKALTQPAQMDRPNPADMADPRGVPAAGAAPRMPGQGQRL